MRWRFERNWLDTVLIVGLVVMLYGLTAAPDVYYTDCGELAGVCATAGVAHPTGYPLFSILGYAWLQLPLPLSPIAQLNILMIVLGAIGSAIAHRVLLRLVPRVLPLDDRTVRMSALLGALLLATARTIWAQALTLEVHILQEVLILGLIYWLVRWEQQRQRRDAIGSALMLGLCFANHLSAIVLIPGVVVFALMVGTGRIQDRIRSLAIPAAVTLSCAVLYAYLPLRSMAEPPFNWGEVHRSLDKFFYHVLGKQYSVWMFSGQWRQQLSVFWSLLLPNVAVPLAVWGAWVLWRRQRRVAVLLMLMVIVCVSYVVHYSIHDIEPYFLAAFIGLNLAVAVGTAAMWRHRRLRIIALALPLVYTVWNWRPNDLHTHHLVREYVKLVVEPLPKGSILFSQQWDYFCSAFWYMQQVEGYRPDIVLVEKELLRRTWYIGQLRRWYGEPIERCSTEIAAYLPLLEEFESGSMPQERYSVIQRAFVGLLQAILRRNADRYAFATPEVLETEPDFAALVDGQPYGATIALHRDSSLPPPMIVEPGTLIASARRYASERLDRGLIALAAMAYMRTGDAYFTGDARSRQMAAACYRIALQLDPRQIQAQQRLQALSAASSTDAALHP